MMENITGRIRQSDINSKDINARWHWNREMDLWFDTQILNDKWQGLGLQYAMQLIVTPSTIIIWLLCIYLQFSHATKWDKTKQYLWAEEQLAIVLLMAEWDIICVVFHLPQDAHRVTVSGMVSSLYNHNRVVQYHDNSEHIFRRQNNMNKWMHRIAYCNHSSFDIPTCTQRDRYILQYMTVHFNNILFFNENLYVCSLW